MTAFTFDIYTKSLMQLLCRRAGDEFSSDCSVYLKKKDSETEFDLREVLVIIFAQTENQVSICTPWESNALWMP